ncbi:MAG: glycosyltransferase family 4 protein [Vicinamibacterales bacterium]
MFNSGLAGRNYKAPHLRAVIDGLRRHGLEPVFCGVPDCVQAVRSMGWLAGAWVWARLFLLRCARRAGLLTKRRWKRAQKRAITAAAERRLRRGDISAVLQPNGFPSLLERCARLGIPTVVEWTVHYEPGAKADPGAHLASRVVTYTERERNNMIAAGIPAERVHVVLPVDAGIYGTRPPAPCPDVPRFLYTSAFKRRKRLDVALRAWASRTSLDGEFHVIGPMGAGCEWIVKAFQERPDVVFHGFANPHELYPVLQGVGVHVSSSEGLPRAMLEYMEYGFPLLVSTDASQGFIEDGVAGTVVDPCDEQTLREAFDRVLADYQAFWEKGRAAQQRLAEAVAGPGCGDRLAAVTAGLIADVRSGRGHGDGSAVERDSRSTRGSRGL